MRQIYTTSESPPEIMNYSINANILDLPGPCIKGYRSGGTGQKYILSSCDIVRGSADGLDFGGVGGVLCGSGGAARPTVDGGIGGGGGGGGFGSSDGSVGDNDNKDNVQNDDRHHQDDLMQCFSTFGAGIDIAAFKSTTSTTCASTAMKNKTTRLSLANLLPSRSDNYFFFKLNSLFYNFPYINNILKHKIYHTYQSV